MEGTGRAEGMSEIEWLVALEEIRTLKARRDRYADAHDWDAYEALHAPDHVSHNDGQEPWASSKEMIDNVSRLMGHNYFSTSSDGVNFPKDAPRGADAFDDSNFGGTAP